MSKPLVSVIVTTYNNTATLDACLASISEQSYEQIDIIVVDNSSTDNTKEIARTYTDKIYNVGPERCTQRNFGVTKASSDYVMIIDSDMELGTKVVEQCVEQFKKHPELVGLVIPEESFGEGFWAQCKKLERSFYVGVPWMEAARAFRINTYRQVGGYDETMVSGEDWDLSQRVEAQGKIGRIADLIHHNEGHLKLGTTLKKKYYYAQKFAAYTSKNKHSPKTTYQTDLLKRYSLYLSRPSKLFTNPLTGIGMLFMKTCELVVGGVGYLGARQSRESR